SVVVCFNGKLEVGRIGLFTADPSEIADFDKKSAGKLCLQGLPGFVPVVDVYGLIHSPQGPTCRLWGDGNPGEGLTLIG
ncbi:MAG: hypothetical protein QMB61_09500, partial [Clostridiaceae bacterium]